MSQTEIFVGIDVARMNSLATPTSQERSGEWLIPRPVLLHSAASWRDWRIGSWWSTADKEQGRDAVRIERKCGLGGQPAERPAPHDHIGEIQRLHELMGVAGEADGIIVRHSGRRSKSGIIEDGDPETEARQGIDKGGIPDIHRAAKAHAKQNILPFVDRSRRGAGLGFRHSG